MKRLIIATLVIAVLIFVGEVGAYTWSQLDKTTTQSVKTAVIQNPPTVQGLWQLTNNERAKAHVAILSLNSGLDKSAQDKCNDMVKRNYWSHDTPDGKAPWTFMLKYIPHYRTAGENLAEGYPDSKSTVHGWMISTEHRENMLNVKYNEVGYGICHSDTRGYIVVQHLIGT